jgi:putative iron-regulated protein
MQRLMSISPRRWLRLPIAAACLAAWALWGCSPGDETTSAPEAKPTAARYAEPDPAQTRAVAAHYADLALAMYEDALRAAQDLEKAVEALINAPGADTLAAARQAWLAARTPYLQSEVFRFGNAIVDAWEGRVNAWPLDEGMIDYVAAGYGSAAPENQLHTLNVIANPTITINGETVDASAITPTLLSRTLHEAEGVEENVATGYHAIEFLLWGQDLNGTGPGAGARPFTDYSLDACTNGNCDRRIAYLRAATQLLVSDLEEMVGHWQSHGAARAAVLENDGKAALTAALAGMGSLSYGELAGERMKLGLLLHDPEEEQDCFSDNTHNAHYDNLRGIISVYTGSYERIDGTVVEGPSIADLAAAIAPDIHDALLARLQESRAAMEALKKRGDEIERYDQMIADGNAEGNAVVEAAIDALVAQTRPIEKLIAAFDLGDIELEGSESLDNASAVFE